MKCAIMFFLLGVCFGVMLNINSFINSIFNSKYIQVAVDVFMLIIWAFLYFCFMLAFNNGELRLVHSAVTIAGIFAYFSTLYKPVNKLFILVGGKLNSTVKLALKKLKFGKKYCKKLLHYNGK